MSRVVEAAALISSRAAGATSGPWSVGIDPDSGERSVVYSEFIATRYMATDPAVARVSSRQYPGPDDDTEAEWGQTSDADHLAAWTPEFADTLADALTAIEAAAGWGDWPSVHAALNRVAEVYLNGGAP